MASVTAQLAEGLDALARARDEWERVFQASGAEPSTSLEWTEGLVRYHLRAGDRFFVVRLERGGRAIGFVPLVAQTCACFASAASA